MVELSFCLCFYNWWSPLTIFIKFVECYLHCSWNWSALQSATHNALCVLLNTLQDDGATVTHSLKLSNKAAANALYRDMTEMHSFYHCDTIGSLVTEQYCRDLKGTIISFFNENTCLGQWIHVIVVVFSGALVCKKSPRIVIYTVVHDKHDNSN